MLTLPSIATADHQESVYSGFKRRPLKTSKLTKSKELPRTIPCESCVQGRECAD